MISSGSGVVVLIFSEIPLSSAVTDINAYRSVIKLSKVISALFNSNLSAAILERSNTLFNSPNKCLPLFNIVFNSDLIWVFSWCDNKSSVYPKIEVRGVRSSWLRCATNLSLERFLVSALMRSKRSFSTSLRESA